MAKTRPAATAYWVPPPDEPLATLPPKQREPDAAAPPAPELAAPEPPPAPATLESVAAAIQAARIDAAALRADLDEVGAQLDRVAFALEVLRGDLAAAIRGATTPQT